MNDNRPGCKARRVNDEWHCYACGLQWAVDDPEPPECKTKKEQGFEALHRIADGLRRSSDKDG